MKMTDEPFGGGNQFGKALSAYLTKRGHSVFFDLTQKNLDLILLTDPRSYLHSVAFGPIEILNYVRKINPRVILVHRINECDERKGTKTVNRELALANSIMDHTIYIASWLVDLFKNQGLAFTKDYSVILNGADPSIFTFEKKTLDPTKKIKLVTHHWGANTMKGWDVYAKIDEWLKDSAFASKYEFHYIGNVPKDTQIKNIILHKPCNGQELASLIKSCDIYITASVNEPAGMHHIEGALCGLPLLYRNSGALPEYCTGFGVMFEGVNDVQSSLEQLVAKYDFYTERMTHYENTSEKMCREYVALFEKLIGEKEKIIKSRFLKKFCLFQKIKVQCLVNWFYLENKFYAAKTHSSSCKNNL